MKKIIFTVIVLFLVVLILPVKASSDYYKNIIVTFNHNGCDEQANKQVTIQLFRDGAKVEGEEHILNRDNGFTYTFEDLPVFHPESPNEIIYEVKILEDGIYRMISPKNYTYEKEHIKKWVQILPENITPGHTYVITTDNWNYENNGFSKTIYMRGDVSAKGAPVVAEYNIINGKPSYYIIDGEPIENTKWTVSEVPRDDPNYELYKDYLIFTNEAGKRLVLTGYNRDGGITYQFKASSKNGYVESEDANYTNKVKLTYVDKSKGRFYIGTELVIDGEKDETHYITLSGQNQYQNGTNMAMGAQFKAYEYIDQEVEVGVNEHIEESLCEKDSVIINTRSDYKRKINVSFDCNGCEDKKDSGITIQLFADNKKVEDGEITLNSTTGFNYTYNDLPVFYDESLQEIHYEVKALMKGKYYSIPEKDISHQKETISKWIQVLPEQIESGKTYLITTENLNYQSNGFSRYIYMRGDVTAKGAAVSTEYNIIDGNKTYFTIEGEPIDNSRWIITKVNQNDPNYETFKDYYQLMNEEGKRLVLTGYNRNGGVTFQFKASSKDDGYNDAEDSNYTNKVQFFPIANSKGKFYIGSRNLEDAPNSEMQYISLSSQNQYQPTSNQEEATQFVLYEFTEKEIILESDMLIQPSLCEVLKLPDIVNPNTGYKLLIILLNVGILLLGYFIYEIYKKPKNSIQK